MRYGTEEETPEELVKAAAENRYELTIFKLHRWQQSGLLPQPRQNPMGYGQGTKTFYPAGTKAHLLAAAKYLKQYRRIPVALWLLWWNGFPVPEDKIRELLGMELRELHRARDAQITNAKDEARYLRNEKKAGKRRLHHPLAASMRRRTGKKDFPFFLALIREIGTGQFETWHQEEEQIVFAKGMSIKQDSAELQNISLKVSRLLNPLELQKVLERAGTEELHAARREIRLLLKLLENYGFALDQLIGSKLFVPLFDQPLRLPFGMWLQAVLVWLSLSASSEFKKGCEFVISILGTGGKIEDFFR